MQIVGFSHAVDFQVVCGQDHTMFLTEDGEVYSCGLGADGQTGNDTYNLISKPLIKCVMVVKLVTL